MPPPYTTRARAGISIIVLMGALSLCTLASYYAVLKNKIEDPDNAVMNEDRFNGLRPILPVRGTIGYLGDTGKTAQNIRAYYRAQYFLAPVVVARDTAHEFVIANVSSSSRIAALAAANGLTVEHDFSNGVALLRRRAP